MKVKMALNSIPNNTMSKDDVGRVKFHPPDSENNANNEIHTTDNLMVEEVMITLEIHREGESSVIQDEPRSDKAEDEL